MEPRACSCRQATSSAPAAVYFCDFSTVTWLSFLPSCLVTFPLLCIPTTPGHCRPLRCQPKAHFHTSKKLPRSLSQGSVGVVFKMSGQRMSLSPQNRRSPETFLRGGNEALSATGLPKKGFGCHQSFDGQDRRGTGWTQSSKKAEQDVVFTCHRETGVMQDGCICPALSSEEGEI